MSDGEGLSRIGSDTLGASLTDRSLSNSMTITEEVDGSGLSRMTCSNIPIATTCAATSAIAIKIRRGNMGGMSITRSRQIILIKKTLT